MNIMMSLCDAMIDLITNVGHSDLYFIILAVTLPFYVPLKYHDFAILNFLHSKIF